MKFFFEKRSVTGNWSPCVSDERPAEKSAEGAQRNIRNVREIPQEHQGKPLKELAAIFAPFEPTHIHKATGSEFAFVADDIVLVDSTASEGLAVVIDSEGNKFAFRRSQFETGFKEV